MEVSCSVFCPLLMVVIPVFAISFIPYGLISFITAFILSGFPVVSTVIFFGVTSMMCALNILVHCIISDFACYVDMYFYWCRLSYQTVSSFIFRTFMILGVCLLVLDLFLVFCQPYVVTFILDASLFLFYNGEMFFLVC